VFVRARLFTLSALREGPLCQENALVISIFRAPHLREVLLAYPSVDLPNRPRSDKIHSLLRKNWFRKSWRSSTD
jgi:hypothetical protein